MEHPTRFGNKVLTKTIMAKKEVIKDKVNEFITERINAKNFIKVSEFRVSIFTQRGKKTNINWSYKPTYR